MRVMMISDNYFPLLGGVEQHVRDLSIELVGRGHEVTVVTLWRENLAPFEVVDGIRVHRIRSMINRVPQLFQDPGRIWAPPFPEPQATAAIRHIVACERPEIIHGHDWLLRSFLPLKRWSKAPLVMSLHYYGLTCAKKNLMYQGSPCSGPGFTKCLKCCSHHYGRKGAPIVLGNWAMSRIERSAVDMFISVSHATADGNHISESDQACKIIPNFILEHATPSQSDIASYLARLPREDFLLFVGDIRAHKGIHILLDAYARITDAPPLVLIGKTYSDSPQEYPTNVIMLKDWPNHVVMAAWRRCSIALMPSIWPEPFGIVLIEAMMSGRPVVASRIGGIPDIVSDGETGVLVPPGDVDALQIAIERLLADSDLRERMGQAGRRQVERFHADHVVPQIEAVYRKLLGQREDQEGHLETSVTDRADR